MPHWKKYQKAGGVTSVSPVSNRLHIRHKVFWIWKALLKKEQPDSMYL